MIKTKKQEKVLKLLAIIVMLVFLVSGCATSSQKNGDSATVDKGQGYTPVYYDFGDVPIPPELKLNTKSSFVYRTSGFSAGVLDLKGRVEMTSLIKYFENNMTRDKWQPVSSFKSYRTILLFQKENRWCVINITDETANTHVEIWVAPTIVSAKSGLLK